MRAVRGPTWRREHKFGASMFNRARILLLVGES